MGTVNRHGFETSFLVEDSVECAMSGKSGAIESISGA